VEPERGAFDLREVEDPTQPVDPDHSLGELLSRMTSDLSELVSTQIELAKVEIKEEVKKAGMGAGLLSGAAVAALMTLLLLSFAAAWGLSEIVPEGVAFLIVGLVWAVVAGVMAVVGRQRLAQTKGPEKTVQEVKEDAQWIRQQAN
jgi:uncharacterized membrane protein YqjE